MTPSAVRDPAARCGPALRLLELVAEGVVDTRADGWENEVGGLNPLVFLRSTPLTVPVLDLWSLVIVKIEETRG